MLVYDKNAFIAIGSATRVNINYLLEGHIVAFIRTLHNHYFYTAHQTEALRTPPHEDTPPTIYMGPES